MAQFKIGDRVRCINAKDVEPYATIWTLKQNAEYIVQDIEVCKCGKQYLNVGAIAIADVVSGCLNCNAVDVPPNNIGCTFRASRFVKVQEQPRIVRIQMDMPEPILN
jgi:hypothetical protein